MPGKLRHIYLIESLMSSKGLSPELMKTASVNFEVLTSGSPKVTNNQNENN